MYTSIREILRVCVQLCVIRTRLVSDSKHLLYLVYNRGLFRLGANYLFI